LNAAGDLALANREFAAYGSNRVLVVDDLLNERALEELHRFCIESTVFFESKSNGYVGAYAEQGFASPLLFAIADQLREALPDVIGDHQLTQAWAYAYASYDEYPTDDAGIRNHADPAAVNVNLWLTPDDANLGERDASIPGGLVVYPVKPPASASYTDFNSEKAKEGVDRFLKECKKCERDAVEVPYRRNRAVIFDSDYVHRSSTYAFRGGHEHRRINVVLLFGANRRLNPKNDNVMRSRIDVEPPGPGFVKGAF